MYNHINKIAYLSAIILLFSASIFVGCESKKEEQAEETKETVFVAEKPSSEWMEYKASAEKSINNNDDRIKVLKGKIQKPGMPNIDKIRQKQIDEMEKRNTDLRQVEWNQTGRAVNPGESASIHRF